MIFALNKELVLRKEELKDQTIETIYFGGGTPSLLSTDKLEYLINTIYNNYNVAVNPEISIEANPDDLSSQKIMDLSSSSINRLSIGIQSFFNDDLKRMHRAHSASEAKKCLEESKKYFGNITIDLIYGIPDMSLEKWNKNLQIAFDFGVPHISGYALTVESKTALATFIKKGTYAPLNDDLTLQHFMHLVSETSKQGFIHYETSNFGKPGYFSRHNTSYWQGKLYLGIGPSSHSFDGSHRSWNVSNNTKYIQAIQKETLPSTSEDLSMNDIFNEYIMTGLRTIWGISLVQIEKDFGIPYKNHIEKLTKKFVDQGLLIITNGSIKTSEKGKFLADGLASEMFMI